MSKNVRAFCLIMAFALGGSAWGSRARPPETVADIRSVQQPIVFLRVHRSLLIPSTEPPPGFFQGFNETVVEIPRMLVTVINEEFGPHFYEEFVDALGPEILVWIAGDSERIKQIFFAGESTNPEALTPLFHVMTRVDNPGKWERFIKRLGGADNISTYGAGDDIVQEVQGKEGFPSVYFQLEGRTLCMGLTPEAVRDCNKAGDPEDILNKDAAYVTAKSMLDAGAEFFIYVNLPYITRLFGNFVGEASATSDGAAGAMIGEMRAFLQRIQAMHGDHVGFGMSLQGYGDGSRVVSFGPNSVFRNLFVLVPSFEIAAMIPTLWTGLRTSRLKKTMADIRSLGEATEVYMVDTGYFPAIPGGGLAPVSSTLCNFIVPEYIRECTEADGWGRPILYWSDGRRYVIVSAGPNGTVDKDWVSIARQDSGKMKVPIGTDDIVFADGMFLNSPHRHGD